MRISQRQMFTTYNSNMNSTLSSLMESNLQAGSQKKINRPSDDPAGMARVMMYRESLGNIERNKANISEATGWLNLADHALMGVSDIITKIKALNLQSSTETQSGDNREQNAAQLRGYFGELLNWANEKYNGQHIFAGHKVDQPAYVQGAAVTCRDEAITNDVDFIARDGSASSTLIQFIEDGDMGSQPRFIYSKDGGKSWAEGDWSTADTMDAGGVSITVALKPKDPPTAAWPPVQSIPGTGGIPVGKLTPEEATELFSGKESATGTWLTVRPTAIYQGDDHDTQVAQPYGVPVGDSVTADGYFTRDVSVRVTGPAAPGAEIEYAYSLDNGSTWVKATAPANSKQLPIPGGYIKTGAAGDFRSGQEFLVHPRRADINFEISSNQTITVNNVGKDIFGGMYQEPFSEYPTTVSGPNIFDTLGKLIGYCETNDSDGVARCLEELEDCQKYIGTKLADVGGRENRLQVAFETASIRELSETGAMSAIEDVDVVTLMTKLAQQQLAYNTVLKSSSMIMQMSLMNFI